MRYYWYRTEFQHRDSPHIHGVLWIDGAPDVRTLNIMDEAGSDAVCDYFNQLVTTTTPGTSPSPPIHPCHIVRYSNISDHYEDYSKLVNFV